MPRSASGNLVRALERGVSATAACRDLLRAAQPIHSANGSDQQLHGKLDRLVIGGGAELQLKQFLSHSVWLKHQVAIDDDPQRKSRPYRQGRLDVDIAPNDLVGQFGSGNPLPHGGVLG
jgi:hypothetical protein